MPRLTLVVLASCCALVAARGRCHPETRCTNSPDGGISDDSEFLPPENGTALELQWYYDGLAYVLPGTQRCAHGHLDLAGTREPMTREDTRDCPTEGTCGWTVNYHICTCVSQQRAELNYSPASLQNAAGFLVGIGGFFCFMMMFVGLRDARRFEMPECDCSDSNVTKFWYTIAFMFLVPLGFIIGGVVMFVQAARDPTDPATYGYFRGCGNYNVMNPVNPGGKVGYSILGLLLLCVVGLPIYGICIAPRFRTSRTRRLEQARNDLNRIMATGTTTTASSTTVAPSDAPRRPGGGRARAVLVAQRSASRLGQVSLELTSPVRIARSTSARRFEPGRRLQVSAVLGSAARPVQATPVAKVLTTGWMKKVLPSWVADSHRRFFVLYEDGVFAYYDKEADPPANATCCGKVQMSLVNAIERKSPSSPGDFTFTVKINGKMVDWDVDPESEAEWQKWEEALKAAIPNVA
jgi:hypothetical protein